MKPPARSTGPLEVPDQQAELTEPFPVVQRVNASWTPVAKILVTSPARSDRTIPGQRGAGDGAHHGLRIVPLRGVDVSLNVHGQNGHRWIS